LDEEADAGDGGDFQVVHVYGGAREHGRIFASSILKKNEKGEFHVAFCVG
jgi:hypothetical protein